MSSSLPFNVSTIGYYIREGPPTFRCIPKEPSVLPIVSTQLDGHVLLDKNGFEEENVHEQQMQSLLEFIWTDPLVLKGVQVVTHRQILAEVAAHEDPLAILAFKYEDRYWLIKYPGEGEESSGGANDHLARGHAVHRFVTTGQTSENAQTEKKPVIKSVCKLNVNSEQSACFLYSAEINGRTTDGLHVEVKSSTLPSLEDWIQKRNSYCYYQCLLGNVPKIVVGFGRNWKPHQFCLQNIESLDREHLREEAKIDTDVGMRSIAKLFDALQSRRMENEDCFAVRREQGQ
ncbi:unnamed protein product [Caenorhabditis sp. 36 PRJEB53466]|nr:unnamed protein product [Caenorhabditis sp. 36 PRJEB53466]